MEERFIADNYVKVNRSNTFFFHFWALGRWLALRLDMISAAIVMSVSYYGIIIDLDPGSYGLLMSQALGITGIFQWMVRAFADTEANLTYVIPASNIAALDAHLQECGTAGVLLEGATF